MKFLHRSAATTDDSDPTESDESIDETTAGRSYTPAKGRPTPKRREAEGRRHRGPVAPPPRTQREAYKRSKGNKDERRKSAAERRQRMASGDDRYLTARDKGPVRAHVRDLVDSRRHLLGLFMPLAMLIFIVLFVPAPALQQYVTLVIMLLLVVMVVEGIFLGRSVVLQVRAKFPKATDRALPLGWYAAVRASQIRKLRMPKPRVKAGEAV
ncbi:MAG: DUF3043 domain-containing protein [Sciscionella sp.]